MPMYSFASFALRCYAEDRMEWREALDLWWDVIEYGDFDVWLVGPACEIYVDIPWYFDVLVVKYF